MAKTAKTAKTAKRKSAAKKKPAKQKARPLFTIGYEQATVPAVLRELARAQVDLVVDTRAVAASRRPGFSKRVLAASLDEQGIAYLHFQKLGTPAEGREAARAGKLDTLWRIYARHIKTPDAQAALDELTTLINSGKRIVVLLPRPARLPPRPHRRNRQGTPAGQGGRPGAGAFLGVPPAPLI